jgi:hypothetical protein
VDWTAVLSGLTAGGKHLIYGDIGNWPNLRPGNSTCTFLAYFATRGLNPSSNKMMNSKQIKGHGRLVPTRSTGIAYQVRYGIRVVGDALQHGRGVRPMQWTKCSVRFPDSGRLPDGSYFLYTEDGKVHQLRSVDGKWHCLAMAA